MLGPAVSYTTFSNHAELHRPSTWIQEGATGCPRVPYSAQFSDLSLASNKSVWKGYEGKALIKLR